MKFKVGMNTERCDSIEVVIKMSYSSVKAIIIHENDYLK